MKNITRTIKVTFASYKVFNMVDEDITTFTDFFYDCKDEEELIAEIKESLKEKNTDLMFLKLVGYESRDEKFKVKVKDFISVAY